MYTINIAQEYEDEKGNPDYEGMIGFQVPCDSILKIKLALSLLQITIYRIEENRKTMYESDRLLEIMHRRMMRYSRKTTT